MALIYWVILVIAVLGYEWLQTRNFGTVQIKLVPDPEDTFNIPKEKRIQFINLEYNMKESLKFKYFTCNFQASLFKWGVLPLGKRIKAPTKPPKVIVHILCGKENGRRSIQVTWFNNGTFSYEAKHFEPGRIGFHEGTVMNFYYE